MRRFLSLFMILLLALRGLAGDVMAMELSTAQAQHMDHGPNPTQALSRDAIAAVAQNLHPAHAKQATDAGMHHHPSMGEQHEAPASSAVSCDANKTSSDCHQHEGHCTACGICHSTLATPELLSLHASAPRALLLAAGTAHFASAAQLQLIKPPISAL